MNGRVRPCTNRHATSQPSVGARATSTDGTTRPPAAPTISRLRPSMSDTEPANGATPATASSVAVIAQVVACADTPKVCAISGSTAWIAYMFRKVANPAAITPSLRRVASVMLAPPARTPSEPALIDGDDVARLDEAVPHRLPLGRLAAGRAYDPRVAGDRAIGEAATATALSTVIPG